jgi:Transposase DDE domain
MKKAISELTSSLNVCFKWNKSRMECFVRMLLGLFAVRTVNLSELAVAFGGDAKKDSRYRRLQRFFSQFKIDFCQIARWMFHLFLSDKDKFYLAIDRTNWYWGKQKINVFMLSVVYEGIAIPLLWSLLPKAGNSSGKEQIELLTRFVKLFGKSGIAGVLADREFGSGKLFKWFNAQDIPFYIRIKEGSIVRIGKKKLCKAEKLFRHVNAKTSEPFGMKIRLFDQEVNLAGSRSERGELMIVATNRSAANAIPIYLRRWEIENLFQALKGRGFAFEATHMTHLEKIEKLVALLAIGFAWAHKAGEWRAEKNPIRMKKFRDSLRPQYSYFRYGLDWIRELIIHQSQRLRSLRLAIQLITKPFENACFIGEIL